MSREDALRYILRGYGEEHPSQPREVGSIPIARSRTHDDPIGLTRLSYLNPPRKWTVLDPKWTPVGSIGPQRFAGRGGARCFQAMPSFLCISSREIPLVSG